MKKFLLIKFSSVPFLDGYPAYIPAIEENNLMTIICPENYIELFKPLIENRKYSICKKYENKKHFFDNVFDDALRKDLEALGAS